MSTFEGGEKESSVLKNSEGKILAVLKGCSLKLLSRLLHLNLVISEEVKDKFTSPLDHDGIEQEAMVRYLLQHVYDAVKDNKLVLYSFLDVLGEFDEGLAGELMREVHNYELPEVVGESQASQSDVSVGVKRLRATMKDYRLDDGDVPLLTELLANGSDKLEELSLSLGLRKHQIIQCQKGCSNMVGLSNVLLEWIRNSAEPCTVHRLKEALASNTVNLKNIASQLEQYFLKEATKEVSKRPCLDSQVSLAYFPGDKRVATAVSALLELQATTTNPVRCQWKMNYQPLPESEDYSSTHASLLSDDVTVNSQNGEKITAHSVLKEYSKYFSNFYKIKKEVPKDSWPPVATDKFINLALISKRKQTKDDFAYAVQGDMDDIIGAKEKVEFEEVFGQYNSGALILVEGRPGSGKTTLMHKVARDWALKRNILVNAEIVVLVPMRLFRTNDKDITLSNIFKMCISNDEERCKVLYNIEKESGEGVCFIIDGLDEYEHHNDHDTVVLKLICKHLLPLAMVIVASRPVGTASVRDEAPVTERIEVLGFKKDQILEYIKCYYNEDQNMASNLISYLKVHINVYRMCYLPVHAAMICFLYSRLDDKVPQTETKIYESFTRYTLFRKLSRENSHKKIDSLQSLTGGVKQYFNNICKLAFDMTIHSKQVVLQSQTQFPLSISGSDKSSLGLVTVDSTAELFGIEDLYTFLHLTFQEYLAAFYLAELEGEEQVISKTKDKQANLQMVWKFYCGMVQFKAHSLVLNYIMSSTELDMLYKIQCAFESQQQIVCDSVLEFDKADTLSFKDHSLMPADFLAISYVVTTTNYIVTALAFTGCSLDVEGVALFLKKMSSDHLEKIKYLGYHKRNCTVAQLETINVLLRKLSSLEVLDLDNTELGVEGVKGLTRYTELANLRTLKIKLKKSKSDNVEVLKMLNFRSTKLVLIQYACPKEKSYTRNIMFILMEAFRNVICFNSTCRTICCCNRAFQSFPQTSIEYFQRCSKLVLINCGITDDDLKLLVESMIICTELNTLYLDFNRITGKGATLLSSLIVKCTSLEVVSAHCNQIDDSGALAIAKALVQMTSLKILDLQGNPITDNGASALIMTLKDLSEDFQVYVSINNNSNLFNKSNLRFVQQNLDLICKVHDKYSLCTAFKYSTYLQTLDLSPNSISSNDVMLIAEGLKGCTNLQTLELSSNSIGSDGAVALAEGLKCCTNLQKLDLSFNSIGSDGTVALAEGLKCCTNLQTLNLCYNSIGSDGGVALAEGLKCCTNLQTLNLFSNSISSDGGVALAEGLKCWTNLQTLNLYKNSIGSDGAVALAEGLKCCTNLQTLYLSHNSIGSDGGVALAEGLKCCTNLQTLNLFCNSISSDGGVALAEGLKCWTNLQTLDLYNNSIGSDGAVGLAEGLKCCTNLQTLDLGSNSIGSDGAVALAEGLKCCTNLQKLDLGSNSIGSDGAVALAKGLKCCTNLQRLNFRNNSIGSDGAEALAEGLKCCTNLQKLDLV